MRATVRVGYRIESTMPPKKKLSAAEKEALRLEEEEEERKRMEAELKRLEEERLKREEEERKLKEEQIEFRKNEIEELTEESTAGRVLQDDFLQRLAAVEATKAAQGSWEKYTACSELPGSLRPTVPSGPVPKNASSIPP